MDHQDEYPSQWKATASISATLSVNRETLRQWVRRAETDAGQRPGLTTDERQHLKELEREVKELRRADEILKVAVAAASSRGRRAALGLYERAGWQRVGSAAAPWAQERGTRALVYYYLAPG
jgi:transposase-like protein